MDLNNITNTTWYKKQKASGLTNKEIGQKIVDYAKKVGKYDALVNKVKQYKKPNSNTTSGDNMMSFGYGTTPEYRNKRNDYIAKQLAQSGVNLNKNTLFNRIKGLSTNKDPNALWNTVNDIYDRYNKFKTPTPTPKSTPKSKPTPTNTSNNIKNNTPADTTNNKNDSTLLNGNLNKDNNIVPDTATSKGDMYSDRSKLYKEKQKFAQDLTGKLNNIYNELYTKNTAGLNELKQQFMNINSGIADRINQQEQSIEQKFKEMQDNLSSLSNNYKKISAAQLAGQKAAAERNLRGQLGGAAQAQIANYVQKANQDASLRQAKLEADLAKEANALKQNYLTMKNNIMQQANMNDAQKAQYLDTINQRIQALDTAQGQIKSQLTNQLYKPEAEELGLKDKISQNTINNEQQNRLKTINMRWAENDPLWRKGVIQKAIATAGVNGTDIPENILQKAETAPTATEAVRILYGYLAKTIPTAAERLKTSLQASSNNNIKLQKKSTGNNTGNPALSTTAIIQSLEGRGYRVSGNYAYDKNGNKYLIQIKDGKIHLQTVNASQDNVSQDNVSQDNVSQDNTNNTNNLGQYILNNIQTPNEASIDNFTPKKFSYKLGDGEAQKEVNNFIQNNKDTLTKEQLKEALKSHGLNDTDIDNAFYINGI